MVEKRSNRGFWLVAGPILGVGLATVVLILALRPSVRRNAAILVEANLHRVETLVQDVRVSDGLASATVGHLNEVRDHAIEFQAGGVPSDDPSIVSAMLSADAWVGAARADSGACYFLRIDASGAVARGTIPGNDCTARRAAVAEATGWPDV